MNLSVFRPIRRRLRRLSEDQFKTRLRESANLIPFNDSVDEDIFLVGYPKSGNTWFRQMVAGIVFGVDPEFAPFALVSDLVPGPMQRYYKRYVTPSFFKTHYLPERRFRNVVYLVRDGRDVMVSYFHHLNSIRGETSWTDVVRGKVPDEVSWHKHVDAWLSNPFDARILTIKYEDLQSDCVSQLRRFCEYAGIQRSDSFLEQLVTKTSFEKLQRKEEIYGVNHPDWPKDKRFFRRGKVGSHVDEMPAEVLDVFLNHAQSTLQRLGYV